MADDAQQHAIFAILQKFQEQLQLWHAAKRDLENAKAMGTDADKRMTEASEKLNDCYRTAKLFEFDLDAEWNTYVERQAALWATTHEQPQAAPLTHATVIASPKTIRERVIDAAKQAYPNPIRASGLRRQLEAAGIQTHEKTVGMTLYRLLRRRVLRRKGWDWFFVPEAERQSAEKPQEEESSGSDPELLLNAAE